jgi:hypothetical protein
MDDAFEQVRERANTRARRAEERTSNQIAPYGFGPVTRLERMSPGALFTTCQRCGATLLIIENGTPLQQHWDRHHPGKALLRRVAVWWEKRRKA